MKVSDIREHFISELKNERFIIDKTGAKTIELIGASFTADEPSIFGTPNQEYIDKEINWYESMSTNIHDINKEGEPPKAWTYAASEHGEINSNYGLLTMSQQYHDQLGHVADELAHNPDFGTIQNLIIGFTLRMILHVLLHAQRIDIKWLIVFIHPTSFFHLPSNTRLQDFIAESSVRHYHTVQIRQWWAPAFQSIKKKSESHDHIILNRARAGGGL